MILMPLSNITNTKIIQNGLNIEINWTDPDDANWAATYIVKKLNSAPLNETDGDLLETIIEKNKYQSKFLEISKINFIFLIQNKN